MSREGMLREEHASRRSAIARAALAPIVCGIALGFTYGNIGGILVADAFKERYHNPSDGVQQALGASVQSGCILGSMFAGWMADVFGRRRCLIGAAAVFVLGCAVCGLVAIVPGSSLAPIFVGRALTGMAGGVLCTVTPLHVSECAMAEWRGGTEASFQLAIETGILGAYTINYLSFGTSWGWVLSLSVPLLPGVVLLLLALVVIPETPRYLAQRGHIDQARRVLARLRTKEHDTAAELDAIVADEGFGKEGAPLRELFQQGNRKIVIVAVTVLMLQVGTGIDIVTTYAPVIFSKISSAGGEGDGGSSRSDLLYTLLVGCVFCAVTPFAVGLVDRFGRRPLLLAGSAGMTGSLLGLAITYGQLEHGARSECATGFELARWDSRSCPPVHSVDTRQHHPPTAGRWRGTRAVRGLRAALRGLFQLLLGAHQLDHPVVTPASGPELDAALPRHLRAGAHPTSVHSSVTASCYRCGSAREPSQLGRWPTGLLTTL